MAVDPNYELVIDGKVVWDSWWLAASRLVFKPGAELQFSQRALQQRSDLFLFARTIVVEDPARPGRITWEKPPLVAPPPSGQAASGAPGGGGGAAGAKGATGHLGHDAPDLTLFTLGVENGSLLIDLTGGQGGKGQDGQRGGDGTAGTNGHDGANRMVRFPGGRTAVGCARGPGNGHAGGWGGAGGEGGTGGTGGRGGDYTLISVPDFIPVLRMVIRADVSGGQGGEPGLGGQGGTGGPGGARGSATTFCSQTAQHGPPGANGLDRSSIKGSAGLAGPAGDAYESRLSADALKVLVGF